MVGDGEISRVLLAAWSLGACAPPTAVPGEGEQPAAQCDPGKLEPFAAGSWSGILRILPEGSTDYRLARQIPLTIRFTTRACRPSASLLLPDWPPVEATVVEPDPGGVVLEFPLNATLAAYATGTGRLRIEGPLPAGEWRTEFTLGEHAGPLVLAPGDLDAALPELKHRHGAPGRPGADFW